MNMFTLRTLTFDRSRPLELKPTTLVHRVFRPTLDRVAAEFGHCHRFVVMNSRILHSAFSIDTSTPLNDRWLLVESLDMGYRELVIAIPRVGFDVILAMPLQVRTVLGVRGVEDADASPLNQRLSCRRIRPKLDTGRIDLPLGCWIGRPILRHLDEYYDRVRQSQEALPSCFSQAVHLALLRPLEMQVLGVAPWDTVLIKNLVSMQRVAAFVAPLKSDNLAVIYMNDYLKRQLGLPEGSYRNEASPVRITKAGSLDPLVCLSCQANMAKVVSSKDNVV